jgi:chorismate dehydratase
MTALQCENIRIGVVSFLNSTPLIDGIAAVEGIELVHRVPSELIDCLDNREVDIALASSIDYQKSKTEFEILPVGVLSSDGESLTVQLCSRIPFKDIQEIHCDSDSHTSIVLLQIILNNLYGIAPKIITADIRALNRRHSDWPETVLVIGDKVVKNNCGSEYPFTLDLGQAWKKQTGLPFVFATWLVRKDFTQHQIETVSMLLSRQLAYNQHRIEQIVSKYANERGWKTSLALQYVTHHMNYQFTRAHEESLEMFYELAKSCGALEEIRPLKIIRL